MARIFFLNAQENLKKMNNAAVLYTYYNCAIKKCHCSDIERNENADQEAKKAAEYTDISPY